ncbi:MAG: hypothetical protein ABSH00_13335 [Bryobacteraceae bacterium]|jgi:hypothetical protein
MKVNDGLLIVTAGRLLGGALAVDQRGTSGIAVESRTQRRRTHCSRAADVRKAAKALGGA